MSLDQQNIKLSPLVSSSNLKIIFDINSKFFEKKLRQHQMIIKELGWIFFYARCKINCEILIVQIIF